MACREGAAIQRHGSGIGSTDGGRHVGGRDPEAIRGSAHPRICSHHGGGEEIQEDGIASGCRPTSQTTARGTSHRLLWRGDERTSRNGGGETGGSSRSGDEQGALSGKERIH